MRCNICFRGIAASQKRRWVMKPGGQRLYCCSNCLEHYDDLKARATFDLPKAVVALLRELRATYNDQSYWWTIETRYGLLYVWPYNEWIATHFDKPEAARAIGSSPYTGKWNFHGDAPKDVFDAFEAALKNILPKVPA